MKTILFIFVLFSVHSYSQKEYLNLDFQFYHGKNFIKSKHLGLFYINESDTIKCQVKNDKIKIPSDSIFDVLIVYKNNKQYEIKSVDFSKVNHNSVVTIGIDNRSEVFEKIPNKLSNAYLHGPTGIVMRIDSLQKAQKICFISFTAEEIIGNKINKSGYTRYSLN